MIYPDIHKFLDLSRRFNLIPVWTDINADLDTPVSAFLKISKDRHWGFLLESVEGQEKLARYSFLASDPEFIFSSAGRKITLRYLKENRSKSYITNSDPLDELHKILACYKVARGVDELPRFSGGMVGYLSYDLVRFFEDIPDKNPSLVDVPESVFMLCMTLLAFDHINHRIKIIRNVYIPEQASLSKRRRLYHAACSDIEATIDRLNSPRFGLGSIALSRNKPTLLTNHTKADKFCQMVKAAKRYIKEGDIIQVVLSRCFSAPIKRSPFDIYRSLRSINPSPYMFFLQLGDMYLLGASPEMLVRCEDGLVYTRPIAGTRPRGRNEQEDMSLEKELLSDKKEQAEHVMLVDLGRNDLGRVCERATVEVTQFMKVERYSHVMHLVSEVKGVLSSRYTSYDALRACFPAGTVSGSPKIRAMQIIDELESSRRGPYAGCVGYFSFTGNLDSCITIRTMLIKDGIAYIQAGAGIVADSLPEREYQETANKAKALLEAL